MKFSVSGLRGIVGKELDPHVITEYALAYSTIFKDSLLLVGRDTRESGESIKNFVKGAMLWSGNPVYDMDIIPTPAFLRMVKIVHASGGVMITSSHNPPQWNALKFAFGDRLSRYEEIKIIKENLNKPLSVNKFGVEKNLGEPLSIYLESLKEGYGFNLQGIKVAVDCQNGATSGWIDRILETLGADVIRVRCDYGPLPEDPEPSKEKFKELNGLLMNNEVDVAFGFDPDGDRVICGIRGLGMLSEEETTALALYSACKVFDPPRKCVLNLSTSVISEKVLEDMGFKVFRAKVGEANVVEMMERVGAKVGGEGNGGLIYYEYTKGRDGILAAILISVVVKEKDIPERIKNNKLNLIKLKSSESVDTLLKRFETLTKGWDLNTIDGYYFRRGEMWIHIRPSNTEPVVRVIAEGDERFLNEVKRRILS